MSTLAETFYLTARCDLCLDGDMKQKAPAQTMTCDDALMIMRADIARFCNEPQDPALVAQADQLGQAHYHRCCPCYGFSPLTAPCAK